MKLKVLGSGSSGNSYILSTPTESLVVEAGLSFKTIQKGLNFDLSKVQGCIISHSHFDHCKAVPDLLKAGIDVYLSEQTKQAIGASESHRTITIEPLKQFNVGDFTVMPFPTEHDCEGSLGYLIQYKPTGEKTLFITDSYYCKYRFKNLQYIMIECNYIKETLDANIEAGLINEVMKPRLLQSHFSLENVKKFLQANDLSQCRKIILLHLSEGNSDAARMVREIEQLTGIETVVAEPGLEVELEKYPY